MTSPTPKASSGAYAIKPFRDALRVAAKREIDDDAKGKTKLDKIAAMLIEVALSGDVSAAKEVGDRLDGRVPQAVVGGGEEDNAIKVLHEIRRTIVKASA